MDSNIVDTDDWNEFENQMHQIYVENWFGILAVVDKQHEVEAISLVCFQFCYSCSFMGAHTICCWQLYLHLQT